MATKRTTKKSPEPSGPKSLVEMFASRITDENFRPILFRMISERVSSRLLSVEASKIISAWFDRLAAGEDPVAIFTPPKKGRPKNKTAQRKPMAGGRIPDDYDVAWIVKQNLEIAKQENIKPSVIYMGVAKALGMKPRTVANIHSRLKDELA